MRLKNSFFQFNFPMLFRYINSREDVIKKMYMQMEFDFFYDNINYSNSVPSSRKQEDATVDRGRTHCCNWTLGATSNARMTSMMS
jgi:hypothetical protein